MAFNRSDIKSSPYYPVLALESLISGKRRQWLINLTKFFVFIFLALIVLASIPGMAVSLSLSDSALGLLKVKMVGLILLNLAVLVVVYCLDAYLKSSYYFDNVVGNKYKKGDLYTFTVGRILYQASDSDLLRGFLQSEVGQIIMIRCGVTNDKLQQFIQSRRGAPSNLTLNPDEVLKLKPFVSFLFKENNDFAQFLSSYSLKEFDLLSVVDWVVKDIEEGELLKRWWRAENLEKIGSVGRDWAYGGTYVLDAYSRDLLFDPEASFTDFDILIREAEVKQMASVLARPSETNVMLVGDAGSTKMDIIWSFVRMIKKGETSAKLSHKRVLLFNTNLFLSAFKEKTSFENKLIEALNEAAKAGNIILIFDDMPSLLTGADNLGCNISGLLDQFFASSRLGIIGLADTDKFHSVIERNQGFMARFEKVVAHDLIEDDVLNILINTIYKVEGKTGVIFTYGALKEIVRSAGYYFTEGVLSDKAQDLVMEFISWVTGQNKTIAYRNDVLEFVKGKVNIPIGEILDEEKGKLLNLEEAIHARVVGQEQAISLISNAIRRARTGIRNQNRPIGSFLFLGPTGVGKTETAKALAFSFFGSEDFMMRLDMSEYQTADSLTRLIGSFEGGKIGTLVAMLREKQYGVLLLDEFEKTDKEVLNLFLQILDEGQFSDMDGKRVNARNVIFIATSNAGAETIWNMVKEGKDPAESKDNIIDQIIKEGIYKPELINRFDSTIIFHPLTKEELLQISGMMLKKLAKRLAEKGITLKISDYLTAKVSELGSNQLFGARPMNRYIQDNIEQIIANKMISGEIKDGSVVDFTPPAEGGTDVFSVTTT